MNKYGHAVLCRAMAAFTPGCFSGKDVLYAAPTHLLPEQNRAALYLIIIFVK